MKTHNKESAVMRLLRQVWDHCQEATGHSWLKLNHAMKATLFLAVNAGMKFERDDLERMANHFRLGHWCGNLEMFYRQAVLYRNASAYQAFEKHRTRKPFIWPTATLRAHTGDGPCGHGLARLVVGAEFVWNGERVRVSSFRDGQKPAVIACSYVIEGELKTCSACSSNTSWPREKLSHRYTLTHEDLKAAQAAIRKADKAKRTGVATNEKWCAKCNRLIKVGDAIFDAKSGMRHAKCPNGIAA